MKVSVIIPTKNEEVLLPRLLGALQKQTYRDFEMIVADAASTDRTREVAVAMGAKVVDGGMPGPGRNRGAEHATGDLLFFMDADALPPHEDFLGDVVDAFKKYGVGLATCPLKPLSDKVGDHFGHDVYNHYVRLTEKVRPHAPGSCIIALRSVHEAIGGFDENVVFAEDMEYVQRAHKHGYRFKMLPTEPVYVSVRRLDKDGRLAIAAKYIYGELYMLAKGPFKEMPYEYVMGGDEKES
jgi:glycosyltransferase involved in cell wall biosynthesis